MTTQLIARTAPGSLPADDATLWDKALAFSLRRLVHAQSWDDPEADLAALQLPLGSTIVAVSSGGCNVLSYLTAQPAQIYAVDLNDAQLALLKLRLAGVRALSTYDEFWQFFGAAASPANAQLYIERLRPLLDEQTRSYWDGSNILGRSRYTYFTDGICRHGLLGRFIGLAHLLARLARIDLDALLTGALESPEHIDALRRLHRLLHGSPMRRLMQTHALLFGLGIPPRQRALLGTGAPLNSVIHERLLRLIDGHPRDNNYFAWQALHRGYSGPGDRCLPLYLQRRQFARMRNGAGVVIPVRAELTPFLESLPAREVDAVTLLDVQDRMTAAAIVALWRAIDRAGSARVRVIFRTAAAGSPLEAPELAALQQSWRRDDERSALGSELDRSGIYGGFHCYVRR